MSKRSIIEIKHLSKSYEMGEVTVHALKDVTISIEPGQVTVILGPSGCGKTTLLNQIGGIDSPTKGSILVNGGDIAQYNQKYLTKYRQEKIGFVFQFFNLIPNLTARENIEFVLEYVMDLPGNQVHRKAQDLLEKVGLGTRGDHYPYQLSGGEQQRVSIARALAKDPKIFLADEPTGELDYSTGKKILRLLTSLSKEGKAVLIVTHNKELAKIAHKVIYLRDGSILKTEENAKPMDVQNLEW
jgi:putative ABC transport system ATP-binding protein